MELILQDEKDDRIHASIDKFTIKYFRDKIYDHDVVGHVVSYEPIQLSKQGDNNSSFMNIVVKDEQRNKLPVTLWGDLAFQMQSHLSGSTDEPLIVVLQLMKTHKFRDIYSIRSCWYQTKLWINADLPQSLNFKNKLIASSEYEKVSQTKISFNALKLFVWNLVTDGSYLACNKCITKVDPLGDKYYCVKCNAEVIYVIHRYRLQIHVTDETEFISLLLWTKEVLQLIGKTAKELKAGLIGDADMSYPIELDSLIEKRCHTPNPDVMARVHFPPDTSA
ncbi:hypothetical protein KY285_029867 [Solanum tuberosum]|nr:hypothetical protein KY285_029867 [Solanum tuberosum]